MTVLTTTAVARSERIRGLEMPWNRMQRAADGPIGAAGVLGPSYPQEFWAECVEVLPEAGEMMTFVFRRLDGAPLAFRAGQYVNISFPLDGPDGEPVQRSYSLSSAPTRPWTFAISIRRDPVGVVSPWAHENLRPGMFLEMLGPVGAFHLPDEDRRARYLLLGAGSGITPLISMVRTIHDLPGRADVVLLYHGARPGGFAFSRELEHLAGLDPRITVYYSLGDRWAPDPWEGMTGRLTAQMIEAVAPDANGRQVFACGPEGYLHAAETLLPEVGVDAASIHTEHFSGDAQAELEHREEIEIAGEIAAEVPDPGYFETRSGPAQSCAGPEPAQEPAGGQPAELPTVGEGSLTTTFLRTGVAVRLEPGQNVLEVARRSGVRIGANCQEGMCGSCKSVLISGNVDMNHLGGIRQREIEAGKFLPCCSTAQTDLVVDA